MALMLGSSSSAEILVTLGDSNRWRVNVLKCNNEKVNIKVFEVFFRLCSLLLAAEADVAAGVWGRRGGEASAASLKRVTLENLKRILRAYKWSKIEM